MSVDNNIQPPSEEEIAGLLARYKPHPTQRFHQRMEAAPWKRPDISPHTSQVSGRRLTPRAIWAFSVILVVLLASIILFVPPVRAIAQRLITYFISAPSNQIEVQITPSNPNGLYDFTNPVNFSFTVDEVEKLAGFKVDQIVPIPENMALVGARYDAQFDTVSLMYQGNGFSLLLTQRPLGSGQDLFSIGQDAQIEVVMIGEIQGEYVHGGWKALATQPIGEQQTQESTINITALWDNSLPQSTLRWQENQISFELLTVGKESPTQMELITWANELK